MFLCSSTIATLMKHQWLSTRFLNINKYFKFKIPIHNHNQCIVILLPLHMVDGLHSLGVLQYGLFLLNDKMHKPHIHSPQHMSVQKQFLYICHLCLFQILQVWNHNIPYINCQMYWTEAQLAQSLFSDLTMWSSFVQIDEYNYRFLMNRK